MIKNYLKAAWRRLLFNKRFTTISIVGLGVSMGACILIGLFVYYETSFDKNIPDQSNVYRLNEYLHYDGTTPQLSAAIGPPIAPFLKNNHNEIESFTRVFNPTPEIFSSLTLEYGGKKIPSGKFICADRSFAQMFGITILTGNSSEFIPAQDNIALTQSMAKKVFGNNEGLNKIITLRENDSTIHRYSVSHIIPDFGNNFHLQADAILPIPARFEEGFLGGNYGVLLGPTYLRLRPGTNSKMLEGKLTHTIHDKSKLIDMRLQPVSELHAGSIDISYDLFNYNKIDGKYINVFLIIALAIFAIACCNFINLNIAINAHRGKEFGIKKIAGASRSQQVIHILSETFLSVLMALLLGILLAHIMLPLLNTYMNRHIPAADLYQWPMLTAYVITLLTSTLLAGIYPGILIANYKINTALKSNVILGGSRATARHVLVIGQFAIAGIFILCLIVYVKQVQYLQKKDLGYSYDQVLKITIDAQNYTRTAALKLAIMKVKGVSNVTFGLMELGQSGSLFGIEYAAPDGQHKQVSVNFENAAPNYIPFFNLKIIAGRNFHPHSANNEYLINETLARQIGYEDPVGKPINLQSFPAGIVVGVVKDYNYSSLYTKIEPLIIGASNLIPVWNKQLYVKVSTGDIFNTVQQMEAAYTSFSGSDQVSWQFMDDHFKEIYKSEKQAATMIGIIGGLAMAIACMGLLALAAFIIARRTKEIGIRKVLGASVVSIVGNLSKEFVRVVIIAFPIAAPVAYWLSEKWLQDFAYRITITWWMFAVSGVITVLIALLTVVFVAIKAALGNPVMALKNE
jgi:putative ABC transport system permease protein